METKYHMSREWRFITIVENENQLEEMRLTRKVYSVCKTFNGDKLKYRCTAFRRTDCKYLMCSIRDDGGKYEIYEKGSTIIYLGCLLKQEFVLGRIGQPQPCSKIYETIQNVEYEKMFVGEDVQEQRFSAPIRFKRAKKNLSIGQLFHMGPGWTFFGTSQHIVQNFWRRKDEISMFDVCPQQMLLHACVLHTNQGNYELYKYGQHIIQIELLTAISDRKTLPVPKSLLILNLH
uniref:Uncharacterized protein n=1 Tax=Ditylenchus dipsaci TaxID=166011 RepID=A0A915CKW7_9BILA